MEIGSLWEEQVLVQGQDQEFRCEHVGFEMPVICPSDDVKQVFVQWSLEFRGKVCSVTHFVSHQSTECSVDEIAMYWGLNPCTLGICSKTFWALP